MYVGVSARVSRHGTGAKASVTREHRERAVEEEQQQRERRGDERSDVVGDALIGVGRHAGGVQPVIRRAGEVRSQNPARQPLFTPLQSAHGRFRQNAAAFC